MTGQGVTVIKRSSALLLIDIQPDFMPGGALPVADADAILPPLRALLERDLFGHYAATQDWHPPGHISFASSHPGRRPFDRITLYGHEQILWPDHCVQESPKAQLHVDLPWRKVGVIVRKGSDPQVDSYSGFRNNWDPRGDRPPTGLGGYLRERRISELFLCGLARDVCVKWSAEDAADAGFTTYFLWDLTRPVDPLSDDRVRADLTARRVTIIDSAELQSET